MPQLRSDLIPSGPVPQPKPLEAGAETSAGTSTRVSQTLRQHLLYEHALHHKAGVGAGFRFFISTIYAYL